MGHRVCYSINLVLWDRSLDLKSLICARHVE